MNARRAEQRAHRRIWRGASYLVLAMGLLLADPRAALAGDDQLEEAGDILQFVLPLSALAGTFVAGAENIWSAGVIRATAGGMTAEARIRVTPKLPINETFDGLTSSPASCAGSVS